MCVDVCVCVCVVCVSFFSAPVHASLSVPGIEKGHSFQCAYVRVCVCVRVCACVAACLFVCLLICVCCWCFLVCLCLCASMACYPAEGGFRKDSRSACVRRELRHKTNLSVMVVVQTIFRAHLRQ